jgi:hypothetical protein
MGARCQHCNQDMAVARSCVPLSFVVDGDYVQPLRYGTEEGYSQSFVDDWCDGTEEGYSQSFVDDWCGDCGVKAGGYHHPGCDMERHPVTNEQAMLGGFTRRTPSGELVEL